MYYQEKGNCHLIVLETKVEDNNSSLQSHFKTIFLTSACSWNKTD